VHCDEPVQALRLNLCQQLRIGRARAANVKFEPARSPTFKRLHDVDKVDDTFVGGEPADVEKSKREIFAGPGRRPYL
jgi:hypothetical protein